MDQHNSPDKIGVYHGVVIHHEDGTTESRSDIRDLDLNELCETLEKMAEFLEDDDA